MIAIDHGRSRPAVSASHRNVIRPRSLISRFLNGSARARSVHPSARLRASREKGEVKDKAVEKLRAGLNEGKLASEVELTDEEQAASRELQLLTAKKFIYAVNSNTSTNWEEIEGLQKKYPGTVCVIDAKLEADLGEFSEAEREEYLQSLGIKNAGVDQLIKMAYATLGLISFLTAGEKEVRAWTIKSGAKAPAAAGVIHTDFEKNFIKAEVVDYKNFVEVGGWKKARELGKVRLEGKEYEMKDGDVVEFKVGV